VRGLSGARPGIIELNETDPEKLVDIIAALEPTFGAINLEDIRSPECSHGCRRGARIWDHAEGVVTVPFPVRHRRHGIGL
jgi:hypothetical protein